MPELKWLDEEVERAALDGGDGLVDATEPGDHYREKSGVAVQGVVEDVHAVSIRQPEVDDQAVVRERLEAGFGFGRRADQHWRKAGRAQRFADEFPQVMFIFDDEDRRLTVWQHQCSSGRLGGRESGSSGEALIQGADARADYSLMVQFRHS